MNLCQCGCGKEVLKEGNKYIKNHHRPRKGKSHRFETKIKMSNSKKGKSSWRKGKIGTFSEETLQKISLAMKKVLTDPKLKEKLSKIRKLSIEKINRKYPFFSQIEEMRYNPDKPEEKEIQVHCKNHNCQNSKEQGSWFTPTGSKLIDRIRHLEKDSGNDGCYFYCSSKCKDECPLSNLHSNEKQYSNTNKEYQTFRKFVLTRDDYICQFCGKKATDVHHERPKKVEPFFSLDPDYAWSCCKQCHYKFGHKDECSTGKLANIIC